MTTKCFGNTRGQAGGQQNICHAAMVAASSETAAIATPTAISATSRIIIIFYRFTDVFEVSNPVFAC